MNNIEKLMRDLSKETAAEQQSTAQDQNGQASLANILRVIGPLDKLSSDLPLTRHSPPQDWSDLIERVRAAAARVREVEADAHDQELRVRELLDRVREDMKAVNDRALAAEAHARDVQARTDALLRAAEERVRAAETRAQIAEEWLAQVSQTIVDEFNGPVPERLTA